MPTMVLVGGAWLGGWAWERVAPQLAAAGHDVHPLTLTGLGDRAHLSSPEIDLDTHVTDVVAAIEYAGLRDVVLVAHSYAGVPATIAANRIPERIARLIYLAAVLPRPGRSLFETFPPAVASGIQQLADLAGGGWLFPVLDDAMLDALTGDHGLSAQDRAWLRGRAVGHPLGPYRQPAPDDLGAAEALPRTYIVCSGDPEFPAPPAGIDLVPLDSGHWPMATRPAELAALLDRLATAPKAAGGPAVRLRDMRPDEYAAYEARQEAEYVESLSGSLPPEAARKKAREDRARFLPQGLATDRHRLFAVANDAGEVVAQVWLGLDEPRTGTPDVAWIYDIRVEQAHRGRGYGRAIMAAVERVARDAGANRLGLNVFGGNLPAIALYRARGFQVASQQMDKRLR